MGRNRNCKLILFCALLLIPSICMAEGKYPEKYYQDKWCAEQGGVTEYVLPDGARVDCLTDTLAVEFDFAKKWAEGIGQARYYAAITGRRGAVALIVGPHDGRYLKRLRLADPEIEIIEIKREAKAS